MLIFLQGDYYRKWMWTKYASVTNTFLLNVFEKICKCGVVVVSGGVASSQEHILETKWRGCLPIRSPLGKQWECMHPLSPPSGKPSPGSVPFWDSSLSFFPHLLYLSSLTSPNLWFPPCFFCCFFFFFAFCIVLVFNLSLFIFPPALARISFKGLIPAAWRCPLEIAVSGLTNSISVITYSCQWCHCWHCGNVASPRSPCWAPAVSQHVTWCMRKR